MSTKMDEDDWAHTLAVFRACLPRRGRKAEDDRRFLEALLPIPTKPPVYNGMIAPRDSWMMPPPLTR